MWLFITSWSRANHIEAELFSGRSCELLINSFLVFVLKHPVCLPVYCCTHYTSRGLIEVVCRSDGVLRLQQRAVVSHVLVSSWFASNLSPASVSSVFR